MTGREETRANSALRVPNGPVPRNVVLRRGVMDALDAARGTPLTLMCAPAGYGKSLAVASWIDHRGITAAWANLNLGGAGDSASAVWAVIVDALRFTAPAQAAELGQIGALAQRAPADVAARLAAWIRRQPGPTTLVLDDLHGVTDIELHEQILELSVAAGRALELVVITRHDPPWPLHRMVLDGMVREIRIEEVRFDEAATAELFGLLGITLCPEDLRLLVERTQGWAAGLRLAALGIGAGDPHEFIVTLSGRSGYIADYLMNEIYDGLPVDWQRFFGQICVVDEVCAELAVALGGGDDSSVILAELARLNAFIVELGHRPGWYRLHPLLLDFLRSRITDHARVLESHRDAARWFRDQGDPTTGLRHALAGEDWREAAGLVGANVVTWTVRRPPVEFLDVLDVVPREAVLAHPGLAIGVAAGRAMAGLPDGVDELVAAARSQMYKVSGRRRRRYDFLQQLIEFGNRRWTGGLDEVLAGCRRMPTDPAVLSTLGMSDWAAIRTLLVNNQGTAELWTGDLTNARHHLADAASDDLGPQIVLPILNARAHLALLHWVSGELSMAAELADDAVAGFAAAGLPTAVQATTAYLALAGVALDRDDLRTAESWLGHAEAATGEPQTALLLSILRARTQMAGGDTHGALRTIEEGLAAAAKITVPQPLSDSAHRLHDELRGVGMSAQAETTAPLVIAGTVRGRIDRLLERANAADVTDAGRLGALDDALRLAAAEELRRPFLDRENVLRRPLAAVIAGGTADDAFATDLLARMSDQTVRATNARHGMFVPLSEREMNILKYLVGTMTTAEIAAALYISVNTVKTHQRAVYQKLGARGRRDAVTRAREFGLI